MRALFSAVIALAVLCVSPGCATSSKSTTPDTREASGAETESGFDLQATIARELQPLPKQTIGGNALGFTAQIEAASAPAYEPGEDSHTIQVPVGTESPIICEFHDERVDAASTIGRIVSNVATVVQPQAIRPIEVVALNGAPAMFVEIDYLAQQDGGNAFGQLKLMVYTSADASFICNHDEPGYSQTFRRIVSDMTRSVKVAKTSEGKPRFLDLQSVFLHDVPVGFNERTVYPAEDGVELSESVTAMLVVRSATDVIGGDIIVREWTDKKGTLVQLKHVKAENGELVSNLDVTRDGDTYSYSGTWNGKPLQGSFESKGGVPGEVAHWKILREQLLSGKKTELTVHAYSPSANPAGPVKVVYRKTGTEPRAVEMEVGPMKINGTLDAMGVMDHVEAALGRTVLRNERIYTSGKP